MSKLINACHLGYAREQGNDARRILVIFFYSSICRDLSTCRLWKAQACTHLEKYKVLHKTKGIVSKTDAVLIAPVRAA